MHRDERPPAFLVADEAPCDGIAFLAGAGRQGGDDLRMAVGEPQPGDVGVLSVCPSQCVRQPQLDADRAVCGDGALARLVACRLVL